MTASGLQVNISDETKLNGNLVSKTMILFSFSLLLIIKNAHFCGTSSNPRDDVSPQTSQIMQI